MSITKSIVHCQSEMERWRWQCAELEQTLSITARRRHQTELESFKCRRQIVDQVFDILNPG